MIKGWKLVTSRPAVTKYNFDAEWVWKRDKKRNKQNWVNSLGNWEMKEEEELEKVREIEWERKKHLSRSGRKRWNVPDFITDKKKLYDSFAENCTKIWRQHNFSFTRKKLHVTKFHSKFNEKWIKLEKNAMPWDSFFNIKRVHALGIIQG